MSIVRTGAAAAIMALALVMPVPVQADYPIKPIRLLQGFAAGGTADTLSRIIAKPLSEQLGQQVVVEAKPGAGGNIASEAVANASPDGYTIGLVTGGHAVSGGLYKSLPFHPVDSFEMISTLVFYAFIVAARPDFEGQNLSQLLAMAKTRPGGLDYGSAGVGSTHHLTGELLSSMTGVQLTHVPYKGEAAAFAALLSGEIPVIIASPVTAAPQIKAGALKPLAVSSSTRWRVLPDVPTVEESGVRGFDVQTWAGLVAPKGTPAGIVARLNAEVQKAIGSADVKARLEEAVGGEARNSTPAGMRTMVASEVNRWSRLIEEKNIPRQ